MGHVRTNMMPADDQCGICRDQYWVCRGLCVTERRPMGPVVTDVWSVRTNLEKVLTNEEMA